MTKHELIKKLAEFQIQLRRPKTQYDVCLIAARCSAAVGDIPETDEQFIDAAYGAARGLFGPAFHRVDDAQRWTWIDMCERALREVAGVEKT